MKLCYIARDKLLIKTICYQKAFFSEATAGTVTPVCKLYHTDSILRTKGILGLQKIDQSNWVFKVLMILASLQRRTTKALLARD